jgi:hypothetical protein
VRSVTWRPRAIASIPETTHDNPTIFVLNIDDIVINVQEIVLDIEDIVLNIQEIVLNIEDIVLNVQEIVLDIEEIFLSINESIVDVPSNFVVLGAPSSARGNTRVASGACVSEH